MVEYLETSWPCLNRYCSIFQTPRLWQPNKQTIAHHPQCWQSSTALAEDHWETWLPKRWHSEVYMQNLAKSLEHITRFFKAHEHLAGMYKSWKLELKSQQRPAIMLILRRRKVSIKEKRFQGECLKIQVSEKPGSTYQNSQDTMLHLWKTLKRQWKELVKRLQRDGLE